MRFPNRETVEELRSRYPAGCRIVLDRMDDISAPPIGTQATVQGVDDAGSVMCEWDTGGSLSVVYGEDSCHKISTEEEARVTLNWYGKHQPEKDARCPRCGAVMWGPKSRQALSRNAEIMICSNCGQEEALEAAGLLPRTPLLAWCACTIPQAGGGRWKR